MLLNQMLQAGKMCEFIVEINEFAAEEKHWDFYLHKVFDKSFADYLKEVEEPKMPETADMKQVETTVKNSMNILENFNIE